MSWFCSLSPIGLLVSHYPPAGHSLSRPLCINSPIFPSVFVTASVMFPVGSPVIVSVPSFFSLLFAYFLDFVIFAICPPPTSCIWVLAPFFHTPGREHIQKTITWIFDSKESLGAVYYCIVIQIIWTVTWIDKTLLRSSQLFYRKGKIISTGFKRKGKQH